MVRQVGYRRRPGPVQACRPERRTAGVVGRLLLLCAWLMLGGVANGPLAYAGADGSGDRPQVVVIPVTGTIEPGLARFVARGLREADSRGADAVLLEINTFGGRVDAATEMRDRILESPVPVFAFVTERAWSAGALIALAAQRIVMAPGSTIGAAEPRPADEKTISALRAEFEATAERRGRDPRVAAAMVDQRVAIEGLVKAGEILSLTADRAVALGFADALADEREAALEKLALTDAVIEELAPAPAERAARFITDPVVSQLLLSLGFLGLLYELASGGWGIGGTVGLIALGLFFGGHLLAGLAGWEAVILFLLGIALLATEVFLTPGFGVVGVTGLLALFGGLSLTFADPWMAVRSLAIALGSAIAVFGLTARFVIRHGAVRRMVLTTRLATQEGYVSGRRHEELIGREGVAATPLRPAGAVWIDGERIDAVSEGPYIPPGSRVRVLLVEGHRLVVRQIDQS